MFWSWRKSTWLASWLQQFLPFHNSLESLVITYKQNTLLGGFVLFWFTVWTVAEIIYIWLSMQNRLLWWIAYIAYRSDQGFKHLHCPHGYGINYMVCLKVQCQSVLQWATPLVTKKMTLQHSESCICVELVVSFTLQTHLSMEAVLGSNCI